MTHPHTQDDDAQAIGELLADLAAELAGIPDRPLTGRELDFLAEVALVGTDHDDLALVEELDALVAGQDDAAPSSVFDKSGTLNTTKNPEEALTKNAEDAEGHEGCLVTTPLSPLPSTTSSTPLPLASSPSTPTLHDLMLSTYERIRRRQWTLEAARKARDDAQAKLTAPAPVPAPLPTRWRDLTQAQLFTLSTQAAGDRGGMAFSLNLNDDVERSVSKASDCVGFVERRVSRALHAAGLSGMPYAFQIEETAQGRLHLHGVLIIGDADPATVKAALMRAGGRKQGRAASTQVKFDLLFDAGGWAGYCLKRASKTRRDGLGDRLCFVSPSMKSLARQLFQQARSKG